MSQPLVELGGAPEAPVMHFAIANGFVPEIYIPLLQPFFADYRVVSLPPRALWDGIPAPAFGTNEWDIMADDILAGMDEHGLDKVVAVGHSMGAVASVLAALKQPERFTHLILLDPTILLQDLGNALQAAVRAGMAERIPMVEAAQHRINAFASVDAAEKHLRSKKVFSQWDEQALRNYAEFGTVSISDNGGPRELRFSPAWEAYYYAAYTPLYDLLPQLNGLLPTLFIQAEDSNAFVPKTFREVQEIVPSATYVQLQEQEHLFPMVIPQAVSQIIRDFLNNTLV
ncbi:MAG: alpha/beta hydrolase [Anaerolineae bacterium]|nr:alpha/beta hydrolase [Anaerolineae bacterium]